MNQLLHDAAAPTALVFALLLFLLLLLLLVVQCQLLLQGCLHRQGSCICTAYMQLCRAAITLSIR
jgi:hypothetical protein